MDNVNVIKTAKLLQKSQIMDILMYMVKDSYVPLDVNDVSEEDFEMNCVVNREAQLILDEIVEYDDADEEEYFAGYIEYLGNFDYDVEIVCKDIVADSFLEFCNNRCPAGFCVPYGYE